MLEKKYGIPEEKIDVFIKVYMKAHKYFQDVQQVKIWLEFENPFLRCMSPVQLMRNGQEDVLFKYLEKRLSQENNV